MIGVFSDPAASELVIECKEVSAMLHGLIKSLKLKTSQSIGANATIVCGVTIGRYAFIGAGAVVRHDVPDYALMLGVPALQKGWMSRHGQRLPTPEAQGMLVCPESGWRSQEVIPGVVRCLDWPEERSLPPHEGR